MVKTVQADLPVWDLSDLYRGADDPALEAAVSAAKARASAFESRFKNTIASESLTAEHLKAALDEYEALARAAFKPVAFANLHFTTDTKDARRGALLQKAREFGSAVNAHLVFFKLELGRIPASAYERVVQSPALAPYRHYLEQQRAEAKHHLSEPEEKILVETANARGVAFGRLFTEVSARTTFALRREGKREQLNQSQILALMHDPQRAVRKAASSSVTASLKQNAHVCTFIYNTLIHEKEVLDRLRGFPLPESERHLDNEVEQRTVDAMVDVCVSNYTVVADYYRLKRRLLGVKSLTHYDRYAPLSDTKTKVPFEDAQDIVTEAFGEFDPRLAQMIKPFFSKRWIDARVADGKSGGAYCAGITPDLHPYVFMNYTDTLRDVMTLAHELGHGVHDVLASKNHMLDFHPVLPLAETASTFAEMLVFDKLLAELTTEQEKLALICSKIEDTFATVFRQVAMFRFERQAHQARRQQGELTTEAFGQMWQATQQEMFAHSLTLGPDHGWWWLYIPHIIQVPFYVYAYAFGELLVLSLYAQYQRIGQVFVDKYFNLLAAGGSKAPAQLVKEMGFDINDPNFWQAGCDLIRQQVERAKALAR
ncbi:MAG TPA: M3 family oligoendopeptidase [Candidatus Bipolaricaulota bacterium]